MPRKNAFSSHEEGALPFEKTFSLLLRFLVYSSGFYFFSFLTADPDLWGHLKFGKDLWALKCFQSADIYSYTAGGSKWVNHEWLSELLMYLAYAQFGSACLLFLKLFLGFTVIFILSRISFHRIWDPLVYAVVFILAVFVMSPGFMVRPQLLTFLFVALFLYCFHLYLEKGKNLLWILPGVMAIWVNCHGGFLIGAGMFPVVWVCEYASCRARKKNTKHLKIMMFWLAVTELAVFANPYGLHLLTFLGETLSVSRDISEWAPVRITDLYYLRFKVLALIFVCSFLIKNRDRRYWEAGIILIAMVYAFIHRRHTPVFAILAAPYLTENISLFLGKTRLSHRIKSPFNYGVLSVLLVLLMGYQLFETGIKYSDAKCNIIVDAKKYPIYAVQFMKENKIEGNILIPFEWGEYAVWHLYPKCRVSVDGRFRTVYSEKLLTDHFNFAAGDTSFKYMLKEYSPDIILGRQNLLYQKFISNLDGWAYVYSDTTSIVFLNEAIFGKSFIDKLCNEELLRQGRDKAVSHFFP
jgi:hypothetical protein